MEKSFQRKFSNKIVAPKIALDGIETNDTFLNNF